MEVHRVLSVEGGEDPSQLLLNSLGVLPWADMEMDFFGRLLEGLHFVGKDPGLFLVQLQDPLDHDDPVLVDVGPADGVSPGKGDHVQAAGQIFQHKGGHPVPVPGGPEPEIGDDAPYGDPFPVLVIFLAAPDERRQPPEGIPVGIQRVPGHIEPDQFPFQPEDLLFGDFRQVGDGDGVGTGNVFLPEKPQLAGDPVPLFTGRRFQGRVHNGQQLTPAQAESVHGTAFDQGFHHPLVHLGQVNPAGKIEEVLEGSPFRPFLQDHGHGRIPYAFDGPQAEPDGMAVHGEPGFTGVDVRRQHLDAHIPAHSDVPADLVRHGDDAVQEGGHVFHRVVGLQPGGLIGHQGIGGGMGFVEPVAGEVLQKGEDLIAQFPADAVELLGSLQEFFLHGIQELGLLFPHGPAENVCFPQGEAPQGGYDLHHLFLVQDDPVGIRHNGLHKRMEHLGGASAVPAGNEVFSHAAAQGTGPVQGHQGDQVFEAFRGQLFHEPGHAVAFHLEHRRCIPDTEHFAGFGIVEVDVPYIHLHPLVPFDHLQGVVDDGQGPETQKIHLQQPQAFRPVLVVLGADVFMLIVAAGSDLEGHIVRQFPRGDHHSCRMGGGVPGHPFHFLGKIQQLGDVGILVPEFPELPAPFQGPFQGGARGVGDQFVHLVHHVERNVHGPAHVLDGGFGGQGPEGDDLGHVAFPVFPGQVVHHQVALHVADIRIDIGHAHPFRVQEPFKDQVVLQRVDAGDAGKVGHDTAGGAASAGAHRDVVAAAVVDEVPHNEEVTGIAHLFDDSQFVFHPFPGGAVVIRVPGGKALFAQFPQVAVHGLPGRQREFRQEQMAEFQLHIAPPGDFQGVVQGFLVFREQGFHLFPALQVVGIVVEPHPLRIQVPGVGLDTQEDVLAGGVFLVDIVKVVGGHQPDVVLFGQTVEFLADGGFFRKPVVLDLQEIVVPAENVQVFQHGLFGGFQFSPEDVTGHFPGDAGGQADEPLAVLAEHVLVDPGLVVEPFHFPNRHQLHQVLVAGLVFRQKDQMVQFAPGFQAFVQMGPGSDVHFAADDGFEQFPFGFGQTGLAGGYLRLRVVGLFLAAFERRDALFEVFDFIFDLAVLLVDVVIKFLHAEHVAVVGQGHAPHAVGYGFVDEALDAGLSVEDGVLAMDV